MIRTFATLALVFAFATAAAPQPASAPEARTAAYLQSILHDQTKLTEFMEQIPKGGDLHHHLTGAVYAESWIAYAAEDGDCFDRTFTIVPPPCVVAKGLSPASRAVSDYE